MVTKGSVEADTYDSSSLRRITSQVRNFTHLSLDQKDTVLENVNTLLGKKFPMENINQLFNSLNKDEGEVANKMLKKLITSLTPVDLKREGVLRPLMSGYMSGKEDLEIFLPEHLETYADHGLILEIFRFKMSVQRVKITRCAGDIKIQSEERLTQLIMGYISELLSSQKIAKISYTRSSYYQLGRMLARAKLVQFVSTDLLIPMKYIQLPKRFLGGTSEFQDPESIRTLKSLISGDVDLIDDLLKNMASHVWKHMRSQVMEKIDSGLFTPFPEFVHMHERRARVQTKKGKGGRILTAFNTIKATKPSTITTVAPWEREAVQELYDSPWTALADLEKEYNNAPALTRDYTDMSHRLNIIITDQWSNKQTVLRKTNHRLVLSNLPDTTPLWQRLNRVRTILTEFKSIETCDRETLSRVVTAYDILPPGQIILEDGFKKAWSSAIKEGDLADKYPATTRLIKSYHDNITPASQGESPG
jgi:hypothetical protein